jgi:hypothetical protein
MQNSNLRRPFGLGCLANNWHKPLAQFTIKNKYGEQKIQKLQIKTFAIFIVYHKKGSYEIRINMRTLRQKVFERKQRHKPNN